MSEVKNWLFKNDRSQAWLAREMKISPIHLCNILKGKQSLTSNVIERLKRVIKDN